MDYRGRLINLQTLLRERQCDALLIDDAVNLFYLTGLQLSAGKLLVEQKNAHLLVDGRYIEMCRTRSPIPVLLTDPATNALQELLQKSPIHSLAFSSDTTSYRTFLDLEALDPTGQLKLTPIDNPVKQLRAIKEETEVALLSEAACLGMEGYAHICTLLKEGITEQSLATELEIFWKRKGGQGVAFDPIIAFGANSAMPHYRAGDARLKKGDIVLMDIGVVWKHYHSDMTRVQFFGTPDPTLLKVKDIVQKAQEAALALCKPGTTIGALDQAARELITAHGYGAQFTHSLGHGVGLEIHEFPTLRNVPPTRDLPLKAGMVITIEPGIYIPGLGGVRIEDTIVITPDGHRNLSRNASITRPKKA